jgi:hypothetical protein
MRNGSLVGTLAGQPGQVHRSKIEVQVELTSSLPLILCTKSLTYGAIGSGQKWFDTAEWLNTGSSGGAWALANHAPTISKKHKFDDSKATISTILAQIPQQKLQYDFRPASFIDKPSNTKHYKSPFRLFILNTMNLLVTLLFLWTLATLAASSPAAGPSATVLNSTFEE